MFEFCFSRWDLLDLLPYYVTALDARPFVSQPPFFCSQVEGTTVDIVSTSTEVWSEGPSEDLNLS